MQQPELQWWQFPWGAVLTLATMIGGAFIVVVLDRGRKLFASQADLNGMGRSMREEIGTLAQKFTAIETLHVQLRDYVDAMDTRLLKIEQAREFERERTAEIIIKPLQTLAMKMEDLQEKQAETVRLLDRITYRLDSGDWPAPPNHASRKAERG